MREIAALPLSLDTSFSPRYSASSEFRAVAVTGMGNFKKHFLFAALIFAYGVVVWLCGIPFHWFTSRYSAGLGIDLFLYSAWATCYWEGPFTNGVFDPYPYRSTAIFIGVLGMILSLGAKLWLEWPGRAG